MFFSPLIHSLVSLSLSAAGPLTIHALSLSNGNASPDYLGATREKELQASWSSLVPPSSVAKLNVVALDDPALQDGMDTIWAQDEIARVVADYFATATQPIDWIITFDSLGVSHHPNHIALSRATHALKRDVPHLKNAQVFKLKSHPQLWRKYSGLPGAIVGRIADIMMSQKQQHTSTHPCFSALSSPRQYLHSLQSMRTAHKSQFVWYRWLWWIFSTHVYAATLCQDDG